jgi:hypothetical protein
VDLSPGATITPVSQATHLSSSSRINARLSSSFRGSTLSISSRIARITSQEEVSSRGKINRYLAFLLQQPTRAVKQVQCKAEAEHVSIVESKAIG